MSRVLMHNNQSQYLSKPKQEDESLKFAYVTRPGWDTYSQEKLEAMNRSAMEALIREFPVVWNKIMRRRMDIEDELHRRGVNIP